ncbi:MAG: hypothetical protein AAF841_09720 [Pseudomonadota bacterium]
MSGFAECGWQIFEEAGLDAWRKAALPVALALGRDPEARAAWLRHGATWFAGVNILPNDAQGALAGGPPLAGAAVEFCAALHSAPIDWDRGQISIVYPGYPRQEAQEGDAAHAFRRKRDAAHVDGLLPVGTARRRMMKEPASFVLGIPLTEAGEGASPMVIWEGSHLIMAEAFSEALKAIPMDVWPDHDLTEVYQAARRRVFETCRRVPISARPGAAYVIDPLALHGVAPWEDGAQAAPEGRVIAYFRPAFPGSNSGANWLRRPR